MCSDLPAVAVLFRFGSARSGVSPSLFATCCFLSCIAGFVLRSVSFYRYSSPRSVVAANSEGFFQIRLDVSKGTQPRATPPCQLVHILASEHVHHLFDKMPLKKNKPMLPFYDSYFGMALLCSLEELVEKEQWGRRRIDELDSLCGDWTAAVAGLRRHCRSTSWRRAEARRTTSWGCDGQDVRASGGLVQATAAAGRGRLHAKSRVRVSRRPS